MVRSVSFINVLCLSIDSGLFINVFVIFFESSIFVFVLNILIILYGSNVFSFVDESEFCELAFDDFIVAELFNFVGLIPENFENIFFTNINFLKSP